MRLWSCFFPPYNYGVEYYLVGFMIVALVGVNVCVCMRVRVNLCVHACVCQFAVLLVLLSMTTLANQEVLCVVI